MIGAEHQNAVRRVDQRHPGREQRRKHHDRPDGEPVRRLRRRDAQQRNLGRGVEAEAEQKSQRKHLPALGDNAKQRTEEPRQQPAIV